MTSAPPSSPPAAAVPLGTRLTQVAMAVVLTLISAPLMLTTHRLRIEVLGLDLPAGLLFGALFQVLVCVFLYAATGSRLPLVVLGALWGLVASPFLGRGAGGGVMLPAVIDEQVQYAGWIVQVLGVGIPFLVAAAITVARRLRARNR
ncbi:hypothetical protein [Brachybacterium sp. YJGR34]|uniref:hypothetical protein n=1 Tax=Brachybacterium sp. YJGR34 TaxID=2059911 RepID=UPI001E4DA4D8|nr:hypothetical protein [Brachybacterium sp. YJGR34]